VSFERLCPLVGVFLYILDSLCTLYVPPR
jgi:hypothetical protein